MPDGSYLAVINGKIEDPARQANGRKKWKKVEIIVRVIPFQISGFRPVRLITSILDPDITDREMVIHYHNSIGTTIFCRMNSVFTTHMQVGDSHC